MWLSLSALPAAFVFLADGIQNELLGGIRASAAAHAGRSRPIWRPALAEITGGGRRWGEPMAARVDKPLAIDSPTRPSSAAA